MHLHTKDDIVEALNQAVYRAHLESISLAETATVSIETDAFKIALASSAELLARKLVVQTLESILNNIQS